MRYGGSSSAGSSGGGSTKLEISFMSIQRPSTGMVRRNREISRAQNSAARGSRKSGKYISPGHTLPRELVPSRFRNTSCCIPRMNDPYVELVLIPAHSISHHHFFSLCSDEVAVT